MTAKERLVELIKNLKSDGKKDSLGVYIPLSFEEISDAILKEFIRREDVKLCKRCRSKGRIDIIEDSKTMPGAIHKKNIKCPDCNGLGWVAKGE